MTPRSLVDSIDNVLRLSIATEQRQAHRLAAAQRLESTRQAMLDAAAEDVARVMTLVGASALELGGVTQDPRRAALDAARGQFAAAALAYRDAVARRDLEWRSLEVAQRTRWRMEHLRAGQRRWGRTA